MVSELVYQLGAETNSWTEVISVDPGRPDERAAELLQEQPDLSNRFCNARCIELIWRHHNFCLRAFNIRFPVAQAEQSLVKYVTDRRNERAPAMLFRDVEGIFCPHLNTFNANRSKSAASGAEQIMCNSYPCWTIPLPGSELAEYGLSKRSKVLTDNSVQHGTGALGAWVRCPYNIRTARQFFLLHDGLLGCTRVRSLWPSEF